MHRTTPQLILMAMAIAKKQPVYASRYQFALTDPRLDLEAEAAVTFEALNWKGAGHGKVPLQTSKQQTASSKIQNPDTTRR